MTTVGHISRGLVVALATLALVPAVAVAQTETPSATERPDPTKVVGVGVQEPLELLTQAADEIKLSDEKKITRWAHAQDIATIRLSPVSRSRSVGRLRFFTEYGQAEVYLVLAGRMDSDGRRWLQIRVPKRPNGTIGWVPADSMSPLYLVRTQLIIDRSRLRATLYKAGRRIWQARVGIGKAGTPTPRGNFWIRERLKGLGDGTVYGPWAFGTSAYSGLSDWPRGGVIGIHGTNQPGLIPGRPSHGCVRVRNDKIRALARLMPIGTPVLIKG